MKKLLSLTLVLMLLFTTISFTSVSAAATMEVPLSEAAFISGEALKAMTATGTDGNNQGKGATVAAHSAQSVTIGDVTVKAGTAGSVTTTTVAKATHSGIESIGEDVAVAKLTQTSNGSIIRFWMADGDLDIAAGDTLRIQFKVFGTDMHKSPKDGGTADSTITSFNWNPGYVKNSSGTRVQFGKSSKQTFTAGQWEDVVFDVNITSSNLAKYKAIYGVCGEGYGVSNKSKIEEQVYPATMYFTAPKISKIVEVATNKITAVKLGEGTVTGDGDIMTGETANLTATPAAGYHFAGWYKKTSNNAKTECFTKDATYSFPVEADRNDIVAVFEKDAKDGWIELDRITFSNDTPSNTNLWGKQSGWENATKDKPMNANNLQKAATYSAEDGITAPDTSCGDGVLKVAKSHQASSVTGMVDGRIGYIPGYKVRFEEGKKYRVSFWIYVVSTDKGKEAGDTVNMSWGPYKNGSTVQEDDTIEVGKWVKKTREFTADSSWANAYTALRLSFANCSKTEYDASEDRDSITLGYIDEVVFERLETVEVTAEATNGTVYGTGSYAKGSEVTLNAGANNGYKFAGYYTEGDELLSNNPTYTFTVNADTKVVAKFEVKTPWAVPSTAIYHYGEENGENGDGGKWFAWDKDGDGKLTYGDDKNTPDVTEPNEQDASAGSNHVTTYGALAEWGIYAPNDDPSFGDKLYEQKVKVGEMKNHLQTAGRFHTWGGEGVNGVYVPGRQYKLTWWVNPVSTQLPTDTVKLDISMQYSSKMSAGLSKSFTLNVGKWNKIEWVFTANDKMDDILPGIRYDWITVVDKVTIHQEVDWALYDNLTIEEVTKWQWSDTKDSSGWTKYKDYEDFSSEKQKNINIFHTEKYTDHSGLEKASDISGDYVHVYDVKRPSKFVAKTNEGGYIYNPKAGTAYEGLSEEEAVAKLVRDDNVSINMALRFKDIVAKKTLKIGYTYKVSCKVFVAEKRNIKTGSSDVIKTDTIFTLTGCQDGATAQYDAKQVKQNIPFGKWTELSFTYKLTEDAYNNPIGIRVDVGGSVTEYVTRFYIDDVTVELVHVDDLALEISESEDKTTVIATATVNDIKSGNSLKAIVIIAAYDADGKLINVALSSENGEDVALDGSISATYTKADGVSKYVAFLWDDLTNIRPYVLPVTLGE